MPKRESGFWASAEGCKCWERTFWTRCTWNPRRNARQDWGLLELSTTFSSAKTLINVRRASTPLPVPAAGYEIHHGVTIHQESTTPVMFREDGSPCGYGKGRIWATYLHGMLDGDQFRRAFINMVRKDSGLKAQPSPATPPMTWTERWTAWRTWSGNIWT